MKLLNYKYLFKFRKSSISFNYYYSIVIFDVFYKEFIFKSTFEIISKIIPSLFVHGGLSKNISWFKFFFLWLRNIIGLSLGTFKKKRLCFFKVYRIISYYFFVYLDYFRFFLYPNFLERYRIFKMHIFTGVSGIISQLHYLDSLSTSGSIFNDFFDMQLKAKFFSAYLKERPLYLDAVSYSNSVIASFFFSRSAFCFLSFFGFYVLDLNSFLLEKGNRFSYGLKIF